MEDVSAQILEGRQNIMIKPRQSALASLKMMRDGMAAEDEIEAYVREHGTDEG